jgi:hypothetical protein
VTTSGECTSFDCALCVCGCISCIVKRPTAFAATALLVMWLPATSLCLAESAGLITGSGCCNESPSSEASLCCVLASASYKADDNGHVIVAPLSLGCIAPIHNREYDFESIACIHNNAGVSPPELRHTWHFEARAAPNPRAPSSSS